MSYGMQQVTYGYVEVGYLLDCYIEGDTSGASIEFTHAIAGTVAFANGLRYPDYQLKITQPVERTVCNVPIYSAPARSELPFQATFVDMSDAELAALKTFMFTSLPIFDTFTLSEVNKDKSYPVRFSDLKLSVKMYLINHNEVTINLVRV